MHDKAAFLVKSSDPGKDLKDGEVKITIRSKGEVEEVVVDGDAVITIKDGKTTIEGKKVEKEIIKTEKKVLKKDLESKEDTKSKKGN